MNIKMLKSLFQLAIEWHIVLPNKIETLQFVLGNETVVVIIALDACESEQFEEFFGWLDWDLFEFAFGVFFLGEVLLELLGELLVTKSCHVGKAMIVKMVHLVSDNCWELAWNCGWKLVATHVLVGFVSLFCRLCHTGHAGDLLSDYEYNNHH